MLYVPPYGPRSARIVIIGEAPGENEEREGQPFVGASGQELNKLLGAAGINRNECYLTNVVKIRPPGNDFGAFYVDEDRREPGPVLKRSIEELHAELRALSQEVNWEGGRGPNAILLLGAEPLRAVLGKIGISKWRGSILSSPYGKVIPTYHPAAILRSWGDRPITQMDISRLSREAAYKDLRLPRHDFIIKPTFRQAIEYLVRCKTAKRVSFDIETTGPHVRCLGLSYCVGSAISIPFIWRPSVLDPSDPSGQAVELFNSAATEARNYWTEEEEWIILRLINEVLSDPNIEKVAQNAQYDAIILAAEFGFYITNLYMDTMVSHHTCFAEFPKGLDFQCSMYTRTPYYSDYDIGDDSQTATYNCYDADITLEVSFAHDDKLRSLGLAEYYFNERHQATKALIEIQTRGVRVDKALREAKRDKALIELEVARRKAAEITKIEKFNPNSPPQCKHYLYNVLGIPMQYKGRGADKKETTDEESLFRLKGKYPNLGPFIDATLDYRGLKKLIGTYYSPPLEKGTDRIYTSYNSAGTVTRRLSSSGYKEGFAPYYLFPSTNLQNAPRGDFRAIFLADQEPDDPWVLVKVDLASAEWRAVCWFTPINRFIERYVLEPPYQPLAPGQKAFDVHTWFASILYNVSEDMVERKRSDGQLSQRDKAKNGNYGGSYEMQAERGSFVWRIPFAEAKHLLETHRQVVWEIPKVYWPQTRQLLDTTRQIVSPSGAKRFFFDRLGPTAGETYRAAYSHRPQSLVADLINRALALCHEFFDPSECKIILQVHDEIVFLIRRRLLDQYVPRIIRFMEYGYDIPGVKWPLIIPAEVSYGPNWYDQTKWEPPLPPMS